MPAHTFPRRQVIYLDDVGVRGDGVTDVTVAWNAALTAHVGRTLRGREGATYIISGPLRLPSNTTLDMTGCVINLAAGSNTNMVQSFVYQEGSGRNTGVTIRGGTWNRGSNVGTNQGANTFMLQRVDDLLIENLEVTTDAGKFAICLYACTDFVVQRIRFDTSSDGVHLDGACRAGTISHIYGATNDDTVALTPVDWVSQQNGDFGDIEHIDISHIYTTVGNVANMVKVHGGNYEGTSYASRHITISHVRGATDTGAACIVLGGEISQPNTNGNVENIRISQIEQTGDGRLFRIDGTGTGRIDNVEASHLRCNPTPGEQQVYIDGTLGAVTIGRMVIRDTHFVTTAGTSALIYLNNAPTVEQLVLERVTCNVAASTFPIMLNGTSTSLQRLIVSDCRLQVATASAGFVRTTAAGQSIGEIRVRNLMVDQAAWALGDFAHTSAVTNLYVEGLRVGTVSGLMYARNGTSWDVKHAHGVLGSTTIGTNGSYTMNSRSLGWAMDSGLLAQANGDLCSNTNAARGNGVGPCVSNGTAWKNLYTGATS